MFAAIGAGAVTTLSNDFGDTIEALVDETFI